jgi:transposase
VGGKKRRFDLEFPAGAVRTVRETGKPVAQVARDLGISPYTLHNWVKNDRERGGGAEGGELGKSERAELARLRAERAQ